MSWLSAVPDVLVCAGLLIAPGLLATYLAGLRGITAWATAPLITVAVVSVVALAGGWLGFRFGIWPVVIGTLVTACVSAGLSVLLRARGIDKPPRDPGSYTLAVVAGAVLAAAIGGATFLRGVGAPDAISQTWDGVFHYNAVRYIEQTGKASPLTIGSLGQPGSHGAFYPDAWHAMAALLAELTGASIPVASTVTCLVVAVLIWPLSCLLLARHLFGASGNRATAAVVITGLLSSLFGPFPWMMTGWGMLWPNALGMALAPAGVALGLSITRLSVGDTFGAVRRWCFGVAGAWAIAIAHPDSALSVAVICVFPLLAVIVPYLLDQWRTHTLATTAVLLVVLAAAAAGISVVSGLAIVHAAKAQFWPPFQTPGRAVLSAFTSGTDGQTAEIVLAAFLLIGGVACFVWRQRRWLVFAELAIVALYVGSAGVGSHAARIFTGFWYDDSHRIAGTLPVVAIPLTTIGVLAAGEWLQRTASRAAIAARPAFALALPLAVGAAVAVATGVQSVPGNAMTLGDQFSTSGDHQLTSPAKLQFFQTVARLVPGSAVVADNPVQGTAFLFALSGTHVLFPQMDPASNGQDMKYLAGNLVHAGTDPRACDLVRHYGVGYLVVAPGRYVNRWPQGFYQGVVYPGRNTGFRLLAADGPLKLFKITMCQPPSRPGAPVEAAGHGG